MQVIMLSGKAQSGKDTVGLMITQYLTDYYRITFADELKRVARESFGWNGLKDEAGRQLLQDVGNAGRKYDENRWIYPVYKKLYYAQLYDFNYGIITDARYVNEVEYMKHKFNVTTVRIERFGYDNGLTKEQRADEGETELDLYDFDYVVHNNGTIEDMRNEVEYIAKVVMGKCK